MELHNELTHVQDEDRLSKLNDDILLSILGKLSVHTAVRTCVLSKRWRDLPGLLPQLDIDVVNDFIGDAPSDPTVGERLDEAMASLSKAIMSLLVVPGRKCTLTKLGLKLFLTNNYSSNIGQLISEAIDNRMVKYVEIVSSGSEKSARDCSKEEMVQHAHSVNNFFGAYPAVSSCLTKLTLYNGTFAVSDMDNLLINVCKQLQHLSLDNCDVGYRSVFKIDGQNLKLRILELHMCSFERVELLCLPKLEYLQCGSWTSYHAPLSFGFVPCLKELHLFSATAYFQKRFKLSELLRGTTDIHTLTLDFLGEKIWLQPEGKHLCTAFNKLRKLSLHGIYVDFGLLWTTVLLEAATSLKILDIEIWDHPCEANKEEERIRIHSKRTNASWKSSKFTGSKHWPLRELHLCGFSTADQQMAFIRVVMERALNLETIVLTEEQCEDCAAAISIPACQVECRFPKGKSEQDKVVEQLKDGVSSHARIIFQVIAKL